jgi:hypothetical protein
VGFRTWPREKPRLASLLEAALDVRRRVPAMRALQGFSMPSVSSMRERFIQTLQDCLRDAPAVGKLSDARDCASPPPSMEVLRQTQVKVPFIHTPVVSAASTATRGPWEGCRDRLTFSNLAGAHSPVAGAAVMAGLREVWRTPVEQAGQAAGCADPMDSPWMHVLVARLSVARTSAEVDLLALDPDVAASTLRAVLFITAHRPWGAVLGASPGFVSAQAGAPWRLLQGMLHEAGYVVDACRL